MPNSNSDDSQSSESLNGIPVNHQDRVHDSFWHELTVSAVLALQGLAAARDVDVMSYTRVQLNAMSVSDLGRLRKMLHELVYVPPVK